MGNASAPSGRSIGVSGAHSELAAIPETRASDREYSRSVENDSQERTSGYLNGASWTPAADAGERRRAAPTSPADSATITIPINGAPEISNAVRTRLRERNGALGVGGIESDQVREPAFAAQAVEDVHLRHQFATGDHEVRHIGSIRRQISRGTAHGQEFAKARLGILEAFAESSQAETEGRRRVRDRPAIFRAETATFQQARVSDPFADQGLVESALDDFERGMRSRINDVPPSCVRGGTTGTFWPARWAKAGRGPTPASHGPKDV